MIQNLINAARQLLNTELNGTGLNVLEGPILNPAANQLPLVALSFGRFESTAQFGDDPPGEMRTRETKEIFVVDPSNRSGPYQLAQSPLEGTLSCRLIWNQAGDPLEGKKIRLYPVQGDNPSFILRASEREIEISYTPAIVGAPRLEVEYAFAAVYAIREFQQILKLDCYAATGSIAEQWAALVSAVLINNNAALLKTANSSNNLHSAGNYATQHLINTAVLQEGNLNKVSTDLHHYQLLFQISGQLVLSRTMSGGAETIQKIFSPGHKDDAGVVNVEVDLG